MVVVPAIGSKLGNMPIMKDIVIAFECFYRQTYG